MAGTNRLRVAVMAAALVLGSAVALLASGALALFAAGTHPAYSQTPPENFIPGEVLVKFDPGASGQEIAEAHRRNDGQVEEIIPDIGVRVVDVPVGRERSSVAAYERNPNVSYAELNTIFRVAEHGSNDPRVGEQWQYNNTELDSTGQPKDADIDAFKAWHVTRGSNTVAIAILDTGIDGSHEDLQGKIVKKRNFTTRRKGKAGDKNGHGTHVAGSAAAVTGNGKGVAGTCPDCVLYNVKVVGNDGRGTLAWLAKGIAWAVDPDDDGNTDDGAEVINMSLGSSSDSRTLKDAITNAWNEGVVLVAAAGNKGGNKPFYPAYYSEVIAVASTDHNDVKADSSNYGKEWVDVAAPGVNILSTRPGNDRVPEGRYGISSGTSMATPHVAGEAGLLWSTSYGTSNQSVRDRLEGTAEGIVGTGTYWCQGRINANRAVDPTTTSHKKTC
jgi:thermitase